MISALVAIMDVKKALLGNAKWFVPRSVYLNGVKYESDKGSRFYEASCRFNILCNR